MPASVPCPPFPLAGQCNEHNWSIQVEYGRYMKIYVILLMMIQISLTRGLLFPDKIQTISGLALMAMETDRQHKCDQKNTIHQVSQGGLLLSPKEMQRDHDHYGCQLKRKSIISWMSLDASFTYILLFGECNIYIPYILYLWATWCI